MYDFSPTRRGKHFRQEVDLEEEKRSQQPLPSSLRENTSIQGTAIMYMNMPITIPTVNSKQHPGSCLGWGRCLGCCFCACRLLFNYNNWLSQGQTPLLTRRLFLSWNLQKVPVDKQVFSVREVLAHKSNLGLVEILERNTFLELSCSKWHENRVLSCCPSGQLWIKCFICTTLCPSMRNEGHLRIAH